MSIDKLIEKTTIEFPRKLSLKGAEGLIDYIAEKLPANIHYNVSYHRSVIPKEEDKGFSKQDGTVNIAATIMDTKKSMAFDTCEFNPSKEDSSNLSSIRFQLVPDWELFDYRPEVILLWDDVRRIVKDYFK